MTDDEITLLYKNNPTIENYLELREKYPDNEIEIAVNVNLDWPQEERKLLFDNGFRYLLLNEAISGDKNAMSTICLILLQGIVDRKKLIKMGETHVVARKKAISNKFINNIIAIMLDSLSINNDLEIPRDLIVLIRNQALGADIAALQKNSESRDTLSKTISIAAQLLESDGKISMRKIAKSLGVNVSTVSRMLPAGELLARSTILFDVMKIISESKTPYADGDIDDFEILKTMK